MPERSYPIQSLPRIPVRVPHRQILSRLGYNHHRTQLNPSHQALVENAIHLGMSLCDPQGVWARIPVAEKDEAGLTLATGDRIQSASLMANLLQDCEEVVLMGATVGPGIVEATNRELTCENAARAVVYDAVGSEMADATLGWIQESIARNIPRTGSQITRQRYSPGYGDLTLDAQALIFRLLKMDALGVQLTDRCLLLPEKSVIGIAGLLTSEGSPTS